MFVYRIFGNSPESKTLILSVLNFIHKYPISCLFIMSFIPSMFHTESLSSVIVIPGSLFILQDLSISKILKLLR